MKIGIITLPFNTNYGGIVQGYAMQTVLRRLGHQAEVVELLYRRPKWKVPLSFGKRVLKKLLIDRRTPIFPDREMKAIRQHTNRFIYTEIKPRVISAATRIRENDYQAYVVGSDQVWRYRFNQGMMRSEVMPYLGFARDWKVGRYAYAASFGVDVWDYPAEYDNACFELARLFDAVSVREDTGVDLCREKLGVEAEHLLDPTMLLSETDYRRLVDKAGVKKSKGDLFCYILDPTPEKQDVIDRMAKLYDLRPFQVMPPHKPHEHEYPISERIVPPVEVWLRAFMDAEMVVTDSFHGCAFSINFEKPFVAIGNVERGLTRMESILRMFHLESHLLINPDASTAIPEPFIPAYLPAQIDRERKKAQRFLANIR